MKLTIQGEEFEVQPGGDTVTIGDRQYTVRAAQQDNIVTVYVNERPFIVQLPSPLGQDSAIKLLVDAKEYEVEVKGQVTSARPKARPAGRRPEPAGGAGAIVAQMTGRVIRVDVQPGDQVEAGATLIILEAMKMENEIAAPAAGTVKEVAVAAGSRVSEGDLLVRLDLAE